MLLLGSTIWLLLQERERRNAKREGDRARKSQGGGGERVRKCLRNSSVSPPPPSSLHLAFLFHSHFPFLLTLSFKCTRSSHQHLFSLPTFLFYVNDVLCMSFILLLTSSFHRSQNKEPVVWGGRRWDSPASFSLRSTSSYTSIASSSNSRLLSCWTQTNWLIPNVFWRKHEIRTWFTAIWAANLRFDLACHLFFSKLFAMVCYFSHFNVDKQTLHLVLELKAFFGAEQMALEWTHINLPSHRKSECYAKKL